MPTLMIGVSTEQNTTNLIPALQADVTHFVLLETSHAAKQQWGAGLQQVLRARGITVLKPIILEPIQDSRIDLIEQVLKQEAHLWHQQGCKLIWNLGGGQKPQQLAVWQTFSDRLRAGHNDRACYANPFSHIIEWWEPQPQQPEAGKAYRSAPMNSSCRAAEILQTFGFEVKNPGTCLYRAGEGPQAFPEIPDLIDDRDFRRYLYELPQTNHFSQQDIQSLTIKELKNLFADQRIKSAARDAWSQKLHNLLKEDSIFHAVEKNRAMDEGHLNSLFNAGTQAIIRALLSPPTFPNISLSDPQTKAILGPELPVTDSALKKLIQPVGKGAKPTSAWYVERILQQRVKHILETSPNHQVLEAYANLETQKQGEGTTAAEYDVLLVTKWGTLIALDAKSFATPEKLKAMDASFLNLQRAGGRYVALVPVFPYYPEDLEEDFMPKEMIILPAELNKRQVRAFLVISGRSDSFRVPVPYREPYAVIPTETEAPGIHCHSLAQFLPILRLAKDS